MIEKYRHNVMVKRFITISAVIGSAFLQTFVIQSFIRPAQLLSGGFTGIALLIDDIASLYGGKLFCIFGNPGLKYTGGAAVQSEYQYAVYLLLHDTGVSVQLVFEGVSFSAAV